MAEETAIAETTSDTSDDVMRRVLDLARWAPSGDNTQPWRFQIQSKHEVFVHGYDTRTHCVYDLDGWASQLSHGALLETLSLAATHFGLKTRISIASEDESGHIVYRVLLDEDAASATDPLAAAIVDRVVQRRPMRTAALTPEQVRALDQVVEPYKIIWLNSWHARSRMASLNARNARIRLTIPEAYAVHKAVIEWNSTTSEDRLPAASLGADPILLAIMRHVMASWERVSFFNDYLGGTVMPRLLMDWLPALLCSGHFAVIAPDIPRDTADRVAAGRAVQRFWLTATLQQLQLQPSFTPLVFARYAREGRRFTRIDRAMTSAAEIAQRLTDLLGYEQLARTVFLGRIGHARPVKGRSLRLPLDRLIVGKPPAQLV